MQNPKCQNFARQLTEINTKIKLRYKIFSYKYEKVIFLGKHKERIFSQCSKNFLQNRSGWRNLYTEQN